jgi:hypothetical protein
MALAVTIVARLSAVPDKEKTINRHSPGLIAIDNPGVNPRLIVTIAITPQSHHGATTTWFDIEYVIILSRLSESRDNKVC